MITYSIEQLHHLKCQCGQWFAIGDCPADFLQQPIACPRCNHTAIPAPMCTELEQPEAPAILPAPHTSTAGDWPTIPRSPFLLAAARQMIMRLGRVLLYCSRGQHMRTTHHDARGKAGAMTCRDCGHHRPARWTPRADHPSHEVAGPSGDLTPCG